MFGIRYKAIWYKMIVIGAVFMLMFTSASVAAKQHRARRQYIIVEYERRLAVSASDRKYPLSMQHLLRQPLRPRDIALAPVEDRLHERITTRDDVPDHPHVGRKLELSAVVSLDQFNTERGELFAHGRIDVRVAPRNAVTGGFGDGGEATHEGAANSENMQVRGHDGAAKRRRFYAIRGREPAAL